MNNKLPKYDKYNPSGVEWLGEIPEHWEVKKLKYVIEKSFSGGTPSTDKLDFWDGGIPWVSSVDVKKDSFSLLFCSVLKKTEIYIF